jgi:hypothetical protein
MRQGRSFVPAMIAALLAAAGIWAQKAPPPAAAASAEAFGGFARAPDNSFVSSRDLVISPPQGGNAKFRFKADSPWIAFDRPLVLSSADHEQRRYFLETDYGASGAGTLSSYMIDKLPPDPPTASPGSGLFRTPTAPELGSKEGARVMWALIGPDTGSPEWKLYEPGSRPTMRAPAAGTATYTLLLYAVDGAGNRSLPSRFVYRLAEPELPAEPPPPFASPTGLVGSSSLGALPAPAVKSDPGHVEISSPLPPGSRLLVAVNPAGVPPLATDFAMAEIRGGLSIFSLDCPYGWAGALTVYYGLLKDGNLTVNQDPMKILLSNAPELSPPPPIPPSPVLAADPSGRGAFILFPSYDGTLFVSTDKGEAAPYLGPIPVKPNEAKVVVAWYGEDDRGARTESGSATIELPKPIPEIRLLGVEEGALLGGDASLKPGGPALIRYEARMDGSMPPEPGDSSPLVGEGILLACPNGEERAFTLRYRAFAGLEPGSAAGEGRILRFTMDKKPPDAPRPSEPPPAYSDRSRSLLLKAEDGARIFASVAEEGVFSAYVRVTGAIELPGSEAGPVGYAIKAYCVDRAGNRSPDMATISLVVDRSSVYASSDAAEGGDGSPDRPFRGLDEALATALRMGKRSVNMRGTFELRAPFATSANVALVGGFDGEWGRERSSRASVRLNATGSSAIRAAGAVLAIRNIDLAAGSWGGGPIISIERGGLAMEDSSLSADAEGDLLLLRGSAGTISLLRSSLTASKAMSCTAIEAEGCSLEIVDSIVTAGNRVRFFGAFDLGSGKLSISGSLVQSSADLGLRLLSLKRMALSMERCLLRVDSGSGYLRLGAFAGVTGEIRSTKILVSWGGDGTLFEIEGGGPNFRHDTIMAASTRGSLRYFDVVGDIPQIWNSILSSPSGGGELLRCGSVPKPGTFVADCVWGFASLVAGATTITDLGALDALNASSALYSSRPQVSEAPGATFSDSLKGLPTLNSSSACVGAALPLEGAKTTDFRGKARPGASDKGRPDIGADQLSD